MADTLGMQESFVGGKQVNIRTMKSDISAFLKETKPSLVQMIATQVEAERSSLAPGETTHRRNTFIVTAAAVLLLMLVGFLAWQKFFIESPGEVHTAAIPQPFFSVDKVATIEHQPGGVSSLREKIRALAGEPEKAGVIKRVIVLDGREAALAVMDGIPLLEEAGVAMPEEAAVSITGPVMPILHKIGSGTRIAFVMKTSDANRALEYLLRNETDAFRNWPGLFLSNVERPKDAAFEDRDFRNISYRILTLNAANDLSVAYGIFPAKQYLILAGSRETFQEIVNRLFEGS
ncbi:MAG: hypothetical protein HY471_00875 [Candidatus Sungbacteria bacterium]|nr:hypothetical protein [Candidatus Sungbacteria bacterium]